MDSVQKGVEVLRKTLDDFTGETFVYANQEVVLDYPIGTVSRLSEVKEGHPIRDFSDGNEVLTQFVNVLVQIDYIAPFTHSTAKSSIFSARELLGEVQSGYYSERWKQLFASNTSSENVGVSVLSFEDLTGPIKVEGEENLWSARITVNLSVLNEYQTEDFPCIDKNTVTPLNILFDIKGKRRGVIGDPLLTLGNLGTDLRGYIEAGNGFSGNSPGGNIGFTANHIDGIIFNCRDSNVFIYSDNQTAVTRIRKVRINGEEHNNTSIFASGSVTADNGSTLYYKEYESSINYFSEDSIRINFLQSGDDAELNKVPTGEKSYDTDCLKATINRRVIVYQYVDNVNPQPATPSGGSNIQAPAGWSFTFPLEQAKNPCFDVYASFAINDPAEDSNIGVWSAPLKVEGNKPIEEYVASSEIEDCP